MKELFTSSLLWFSLGTTVLFAQEPIKLSSPDGQIKVEIRLDNLIHYDLFVDGKLMVEDCLVSMELEKKGVLGDQPNLRKKSVIHVDNTIKPVIRQKTSEIRDQYNELTLTFKNSFDLVFRAYNNGVAYRFQTKFKEEIKVVNETANFCK